MLIVACSVRWTVRINIAFHTLTMDKRISIEAWKTATGCPMIFSVAFGVGGTGITQDARVDALTVVALEMRWALIV